MKSTNYKMKITDQRIELFDGRPDRETVIGLDDILNLRIALETAISFENFLELV